MFIPLLPADAGKELAAASATWTDGQQTDTSRWAVGQADFVRSQTKLRFAQGQNPTDRKRKQRDIIPCPAAAKEPSLVCFPLGFLTVLIDIILVLAQRAAKGCIVSAAQEHLLTMLAQAQGLVIVHQHEAEHYLESFPSFV